MKQKCQGEAEIIWLVEEKSLGVYFAFNHARGAFFSV
jgi:hypothetical protein